MMQMMNQMTGLADSNPAKKQRTEMSGYGGAQSGTKDPWVEGQLDKWIIAKRSKDFAQADQIRDELRAMGVDPDTERPRGWSGEGGKTGDAWMDDQLDKWLIAKKQRDFVTADAIRDELRGMGIDPDSVRPKGWSTSNGTGAAHAGAGKTGDPWTDEQLDKWLAAKRAKDFL